MTPPRRLLPASHPVRAAVVGWLGAGHIAPGTPLIVACSGGADSLALAAAALAEAGSRSVSAMIVDHQLQTGSAGVATRAADQLRDLGYRQVDIRRVEVGGEGGTEAAARRARYAALAAGASSIGAAVLLAHTMDDQAETVLLGLGRGSGPRSIAGMRPWRAPWGRPLISVRRNDTEDACRSVGLTPWIDPHNSDPVFTRVRLRREVLPLLDEVLGGGVVSALARTAELMADDLDALDLIGVDALGAAVTGGGGLDCAVLAEHPTAVRRRVLRQWAMDKVGPVGYDHLIRLEHIALAGAAGQSVRLPGGVDAVRRRGELHFETPGSP